ncbi:MAG: hypothetical protein ABIF01_04750, partial [Candidatus Micrarchaeota archaeon]
MRESERFISVLFLLLVLLPALAFSLCGRDPDPLICPPCLLNPRSFPNCCGDGDCTLFLRENCINCPSDCPTCSATCGDGICAQGTETVPGPNFCETDCGTCGAGGCQPLAGENCYTCRTDCGACPSCELTTTEEDCFPALPAEQQNCTYYYCNPNENTCVFVAHEPGKFCGNEQAPYRDACHVDVCIKGACIYDAPIDSANPLSAGGVPPLTNTMTPWLTGFCVFNTTLNDYDYVEVPVHPFCGAWGCEAADGENNPADPNFCCEDCGCGADEICSLGVCEPIAPTI